VRRMRWLTAVLAAVALAILIAAATVAYYRTRTVPVIPNARWAEDQRGVPEGDAVNAGRTGPAGHTPAEKATPSGTRGASQGAAARDSAAAGEHPAPTPGEQQNRPQGRDR
jgi:hypothetical protein